MSPIGSDAVGVDDLLLAAGSAGRNFRILSPGPQLSGPALRGRHARLRLTNGLVLHYSDAIDLHDLATRIEQYPGVTLQVFLDGAVEARSGGRDLFDGDGGLAQPLALIQARTRPELFERQAKKGARLRKVSLTLPPGWLAEAGLDGLAGSGFDLARFAATHLARQSWQANSRQIALAEEILAPPVYRGPLNRLHLESRAMALIVEMLASLGVAATNAGLAGRERRRLRRVEEILEQSRPTALKLDDLARDAGCSISTLQRLFQAAYGMSAFEAIRRRNLQEARRALNEEGLTVKEAAYRAGYSSAANFATAFRRMFGTAPSDITRS